MGTRDGVTGGAAPELETARQLLEAKYSSDVAGA